MEKMGDIRTTEDEMRKILSKLMKVDKSPGPDNMHPYFLKETANELASPLNIIFNRSPELSEIPDEWKKGRITALLKRE